MSCDLLSISCSCIELSVRLTRAMKGRLVLNPCSLMKGSFSALTVTVKSLPAYTGLSGVSTVILRFSSSLPPRTRSEKLITVVSNCSPLNLNESPLAALIELCPPNGYSLKISRIVSVSLGRYSVMIESGVCGSPPPQHASPPPPPAGFPRSFACLIMN